MGSFIIDSKTCLSTVTAIQDTKCIVVPRKIMKELIEFVPDFNTLCHKLAVP